MHELEKFFKIRFQSLSRRSLLLYYLAAKNENVKKERRNIGRRLREGLLVSTNIFEQILCCQYKLLYCMNEWIFFCSFFSKLS